MQNKDIRSEVVTKIREYIKSSSFNHGNVLNDELHIFDEGILDSMGLLGLISFLKENFNIQVSDKDLTEENFESVKAITNFVLQRQN